MPFSEVWSSSKSTLSFSRTSCSGSTAFPIRSSLIEVYTVCHSQQTDQGLHCLQFSAVSSRPTLFAILSSLIRIYTIAVLSSLSWVYACCHFEQSDHGLHYFPFFRSSFIKVCTVCHFQLSDQALHYLSFSAVWWGSTLFPILISLIRVYTDCHSQQSFQRLHWFLFSAVLHFLPFSVWSVSTLFAILSSMIRIYTICHSFLTVSSRSTLFAIVCQIRVYIIYYSQQCYKGLYCLPFSAVWSGLTLFSILSN